MVFSPYRMFAITRKELRHITRDFRIFFLVTISPAFLLLILAYLFALDVGNVNLAWLDGDRTATSRAYLAAITDDGTFRLTEIPTNYAQVGDALLAGQADVALVVPPGFESDLLAGRQTEVQVVADGSDAIATSQALGGLASRTAAYGAQLAHLPELAQIRTRVWYNAGLKSQWSMVPGLLAIVLTLPVLALTLAIKREQEVGTLEALIATPINSVEYQLGKLVAYIFSGLISAALAVAVAVLWFGVPLRGSWLLLALLTVDFYLACMGISLLVAQFVTSQQTAMLLVLLLFFVPGFFISGLILPVDTSSWLSLVISYMLPVTHLVASARAIFLKGAGLAELRLHAEILAAVGFSSLAISLLFFRKRMG